MKVCIVTYEIDDGYLWFNKEVYVMTKNKKVAKVIAQSKLKEVYGAFPEYTFKSVKVKKVKEPMAFINGIKS